MNIASISGSTGGGGIGLMLGNANNVTSISSDHV